MYKVKAFIKKLNLKYTLQSVLNISLVFLALTMSWLLFKEGYYLFRMAFFSELGMEHKKLLESVLIFFLYFEFLSMILKYFKDDYHFPLRYFMYIGITATIRYIVVDHEDALQTLYFCGSILLLVISYAVITLLSLYKNNRIVK